MWCSGIVVGAGRAEEAEAHPLTVGKTPHLPCSAEGCARSSLRGPIYPALYPFVHLFIQQSMMSIWFVERRRV
jgi:hypothetical protein